MTRKILPLLIAIIIFITLVLFIQPVSSAPLSSQTTPTPTPYPGFLSTDELGVEVAIQQAVASEENVMLAYLVYETQITDIQISADNEWAIGWLFPVDTETGQVVPAEPGLVIVKRANDFWQAILPSDPEWSAALQEAPTDLISSDAKALHIEEQSASQMAMAITATYGGYYLPWTRNVTMAMTQSVHHDKYTPSGSAHFSFDFATPGYPAQMFNVLAAKSGRVKFFKDTCSNGSTSCSNYIVLEDTNTNPTTYQLYLHLAYGSIPSGLKETGKRVGQGQLIGIADDTGVSTAHHLHFMVHTNSTSYWGTSVDITFKDVPINGGRPRIASDLSYCKSSDVCDSTSTYYVSQNSFLNDFDPPEGGISSPGLNQNISSPSVTLTGWAKDNKTGIGNAQFIALYNGEWHNIGSATTAKNFSYSWDMCSDSVPDGPVSVALNLQDVAGNQTPGLPGLTHFMKNYDCSNTTPACYPSTNQVALYSNTFYQGECVTLDTGSYSGSSYLGNIGNNNVESILVGKSVMATLYASAGNVDRGETFLSNDANLVDNIIGSNNLSSLIVSSRSTSPGVPTKVFPASGAQFPFNTSLSLVWDNGSGDSQYQAQINNGATTTTTDWQNDPFWNLGSLPAGTYTWRVRAKNDNGISGWNTATGFTILSSSTTPATVSAPFTATMEDLAENWEHSDHWDLTAERNHTTDGQISWEYDTNSSTGYDTGSPNQGDLTSPSITIPSGETYYLRFWYFYETESLYPHWDQRWVQISIDGGTFANVMQLSDDPVNAWLQSPAISLASYAGHTIRVRFHFETLDKIKNTYLGWTIDDVSVTTTAPESCSDAHETPETAPLLETAQYSSVICPNGDVDYFKIAVTGGDHLGFYVQGNYSIPDSVLDPQIAFLDIDKTSPLVENDDQVLAKQTDSEITFSPTIDAIFYLKIKAWDHPSGGSNNHTYILNVYNESNDPSGSFISPQTNAYLPSGAATLSVSASDAESGISHVEFYIHAGDWETASDWTKIGEDWNSDGGWTLDYDFSQLSFQGGMGLYARIYDRAGNWSSTGVWNIGNPSAIYYLPCVNY